MLRIYPTTPIGLDQEAGYAVLNRGSLEITPDDVNKVIQKAVNQTHETIPFPYHVPTTSPQKDSLFSKVILACALAPRDELGYFAPADVRDPLYVVVRKRLVFHSTCPT